MSEEKESPAPAAESGSSQRTPEQKEEEGLMVFEYMTRKPLLYFFLFLLPILWGIFTGVGWSKDERIEEAVYNIWTRQRSEFSKDVDYSISINRDSSPASTFAAMAFSRDGGNLFTPERLEEIRSRMEETEATTVEYKGETYTWDDLCLSNNAGPGTAYKFPCLRLSPMDYFKEARWFFEDEDRVTWYQEIARKTVIAPRISRFGILQGVCSNLTIPTGRTECDDLITLRLTQNAPLLLFVDIGSMENNDPCKMCVDGEFETTMRDLEAGATQMFQGLFAFASATGQAELAATYASILQKLDRQAVIDFYSYYVTRNLYIELGKPTYMQSRDLFNQILSGCTNEGSTTPCPPATTEEEAEIALANHADHTFSSSVTSGNPLPLWGDDGEGFLLQGTSPVGGSGVKMSGSLFSTVAFFGLEAPTAEDFNTYVIGDPVHSWFIAGETPMTAHCGNGDLKGTNGFGAALDAMSAKIMQDATQKWCTKYNVPFEVDGQYTAQYFARMWFDLLQDSESFLGITQGESDPYIWTTGLGCGYSLGGTRYEYNTSTSQEELMASVSNELYYIDEGELVGAIDTSLLLGGLVPKERDASTPLEKSSVIQSIYATLIPESLVDRVKNCNRPGGPVDITVDDASEILEMYKEAMEDSWTRGWNDDSAGDVAFVGFFDDNSVIGTTGRMLREITLSNGSLLVTSIVIIAVFSVLFVTSANLVESRTMITILGVALVNLAFFAAVGFALMCGIKINVTIAWTLPFVMLGLGVDDMYIVLLSLREQPGFTLKDFRTAMSEVFVPITMTSIVNASMFAIMNINDVPAVYLTAQVALISVAFLYLTIAFCFTTWCYLDMQRQSNGRNDILCWRKTDEIPETKAEPWTAIFYKVFYRPVVLKAPKGVLAFSHAIIWLIFGTILGLGIWGLTEKNREIGLGLEDFFPSDNPAGKWATIRTEELASWSIQMNWGEVDYTKPTNQMQVIQQFEKVVGSANVAELDTKYLWLADFLVWTTNQCTENFGRQDPYQLVCGMDQVFEDGSTCSGVWMPNTLGLREKVFTEGDECVPFEGGICRPSNQMHPDDVLGDGEDLDSWCPVVEGWSNDKLSFCLGKWRNFTGGSGRLLLLNETGTPDTCEGEYLNDETVEVPVRYASGPSMFAIDMFTHQLTLDMIDETRAVCDDHPEIHCWLTGIPYHYWSQYIGIFETFWEIGGTSIAAGFVVAFLFLTVKLMRGRRHSPEKVLAGSLTGSLLIATTTMVSLICVSGLSSLFNVAFTGFSTMSFVLSVGFAVEYSVHVVARWLLAPMTYETSLSRVEYAMQFLFLPTFMSFVSSTIGVICLAFTEFQFNEVFFFRPLLIVMLVTYFLGCWWLPVLLSLLDFDFVKFGKAAPSSTKSAEAVNDEEEEEVLDAVKESPLVAAQEPPADPAQEPPMDAPEDEKEVKV